MGVETHTGQCASLPGNHSGVGHYRGDLCDCVHGDLRRAESRITELQTARTVGNEETIGMLISEDTHTTAKIRAARRSARAFADDDVLERIRWRGVPVALLDRTALEGLLCYAVTNPLGFAETTYVLAPEDDQV